MSELSEKLQMKTFEIIKSCRVDGFLPEETMSVLLLGLTIGMHTEGFTRHQALSMCATFIEKAYRTMESLKDD